MTHTLVHMLRDNAVHTPESRAVVLDSQHTTYRRLWADICAVAAFLKKNGLQPGDRVGVLLKNSPEYIAAYYGVLAAGGVVVGLNTMAKSRDLANWLQHSGASWLFAEGQHPELINVTNSLDNTVQLVLVGEPKGSEIDAPCHIWQELLQATETGEEPDLSRLESAQTAAIIYTSGTTGQPKGVTLSHGNLSSNVRSIQQYLQLTANDRVLNVLPFYYSYGNSVLHTHLAVGATLVLENNLLFPHNVLTTMANERATGFSGVPSTFAILLSRTRMENYELSSLRYMTQAGGAMAPAMIERLRKTLPHVRFFVMYGQTEATARLAWLPPEMLDAKPGSIGIAIPGVRLELRDKQGQPVAAGETGEIWAAGENIMQGYWRDPELTCKVLEDGWLKTGDLAHCDEDGYFYIDGRSADMIKIGANRISPKEIEEVILELDGVEEAAVVGVPDELLGQVIKAVIVPSPGAQIEIKQIRAHCWKQLAMYKVPKFIDFVTELPKTASGKVQRFLLAERS